VEVKIGIQLAPRELVIETTLSADDVIRRFHGALADGHLLTLDDTKGNTVLIAADKIAYLELGPSGQRQVGFG
jgi:Protein of unknown function (DUF3107)